MARTYLLHELKYSSGLGPAAIEKSFKKMRSVVERAQKKCGKLKEEKSLLRIACYLGGICHQGALTKGDNSYVNPHTFGDRIFLEEVGTYKCVEFKNNTFKDRLGNFVNIVSYQ